MWQLYLPIANQSVNIVAIILLGAGVGVLSGMFGVGGGFLTTPLLIFYGIPPTVAVASSATQVAGTSVSGLLAHWQRGSVDAPMGLYLAAGGIVGTGVGAVLFGWLQSVGQIDTVISIMYLLLLGSVGTLMARDAIRTIRNNRLGTGAQERRTPHNPLIANLPLRKRFYKSGVYLSPMAPVVLGFVGGVLTVLLGVGGGFIMVPAMIYLLGMAARVVVGTSLLQILIVTSATTLVHALTTKAVDIVLASLLLVGGVIGAQFGARIAVGLPPERLRLLLASIVLVVAFLMFLELLIQPADIFTIEPLS
jgi:uncharacterized protein